MYACVGNLVQATAHALVAQSSVTQGKTLFTSIAILSSIQHTMMAAREWSPQVDDEHPSLSASLEDFENNGRSPAFGLPSQHSGFKLEESVSEDEPVSEEPWSPPAWRQQNAAGGWYRHQPYPQDNNLLKASVSASRSRGTSYESAREDEDVTMPANIPLPRGSMSPVKEQSPEPSPSPYPEGGQDFGQKFGGTEEAVAVSENQNNCVQPLCSM